MLIKLGIGDAARAVFEFSPVPLRTRPRRASISPPQARAIFEHLLTLPASLSPEQQSLVKRRIAQLKATPRAGGRCGAWRLLSLPRPAVRVGGRAGGEDDAVPPPHARHRFAAAARRPRQSDAEVLLRSHLPPCRRLAALVYAPRLGWWREGAATLA